MMKIGVYLIVFGILMGTTIAELLLVGIICLFNKKRANYTSIKVVNYSK